MSANSDEDCKNNPYLTSSLLRKIQKNKKHGKPIRLAFVDIDFTFTSKPSIIASTKRKLEQLGYSIIFVTSRTEEMVMGEGEYNKSKKLGFSRPKPHLAIKKHKRTYIDPQRANPLLVNPDIIIGSTGTQIVIKQQTGGYISDASFEKDFGFTSEAWRKKTMDLIKKINYRHSLVTLPLFEFKEMYLHHDADVYPPKFRIQVSCKSLQAKNTFIAKLKNELAKEDYTFLRIIDDSNMRQKDYVIFLMPFYCSKRKAVNHVVNHICSDVNVSKKDMDIIFAGDSYPDLAMLFYGAKGANITAILVGGSRISKTLLDKDIHQYAGEDLSIFKQNMQCLSGKKGFFFFSEDNKTIARNIIIGDLAYPNTKGPATILAYLNQ